MFTKIRHRFRDFERDFTRRYGRSIDTPEDRRRAMWHFNYIDHGILRGIWWNLEEIAPGVWRSNQPSPKRMERYAQMGIKSILNLRGEKQHSPFLFEQEACARHGIAMHNIELSARKLVSRKAILKLIKMMRQAEKPMLMHCKSGSDRAGFASVLYLAIIEGRPIAEARKHLHWKYLHLSSTDTGILDHVLDVYERDAAQSGASLEEWIAQSYDHVALTESWNASRR